MTVEVTDVPGSLVETIAKTKAKTARLEHNRRVEQKQEREAQKRLIQRRNYILGELVTKYFPEVCKLKPGTKEENAITFMPVEAFLTILSQEQKLVQALKIMAARLTEADTGKP